MNAGAPHLQNLEMEMHHPSGVHLDELKKENGNTYTRSSGEVTSFNADAPLLQRNFQGNSYDGSTPNDNDLAISNDGKLVSVINSSIYIYDVDADSELVHFNLGDFADTLKLPQHKFDPKVIYDPKYDRFVIVFLNGSLDSTSKIILAFSKTNDPSGDWHLYALPGNPVNNDTWSDFPVVGMSEEELFIGINTFKNGSENNSGFEEATFWQIEKKRKVILAKT